MNSTWMKMIQETMDENDDPGPIISCTINDDQLNKEFYSGYGGPEGQPFTAWSAQYVYFPICYDGAEWVGSAPRNPCDTSLGHQGG